MQILHLLLLLIPSGSLDSTDYHEREGESKRLRNLGLLAAPFLVFTSPTTPEGRQRWEEATDRIWPGELGLEALRVLAGDCDMQPEDWWCKEGRWWTLARTVDRYWPLCKVSGYDTMVHWMSVRSALGIEPDVATMFANIGRCRK